MNDDGLKDIGASDAVSRFPRKRFFRIWMILFLIFFGVSYISGFMPTGAKETFLSFVRPSDSNSSAARDVSLQKTKAPILEIWTAPRIIIPQILVDSPITLPNSSDLDVLNADLLKGVVHYPNSVMPGKTGNVLLFGHSTTLPVVRNKAYQVFSRLKELKKGDVITIRSDSSEYSYIVKKVEITEADDARIDFTSDKKILTLSTCNIIGGKESRYVVEAEFLRSYPLGSKNSSPDTSSKI